EEPGAGLMLCSSTFGSQRGLFVARNRLIGIWETTHFIVWKLHDLHEEGWEAVKKQALSRDHHRVGLAHPAAPLTLATFLAPRAVEAADNRLRKRHQLVGWWRIGIRRAETPLPDTPPGTTLTGFRWLHAPRAHYWADPFLFQRNGKTYLFFEDFDDAR